MIVAGTKFTRPLNISIPSKIPMIAPNTPTYVANLVLTSFPPSSPNQEVSR